MRRLHLAALCLAFSAMGCPVTDTALPEGAQLITDEPTIVLHEAYSMVGERRRLVITSAMAWDAFWEQAMGNRQPTPPDVDFEQNVVIVASSGGKPSGGFWIDVEGLYEADGEVFAIITETSPGSACGVTAAITSPIVAVVVPRRDPLVVFIERPQVRQC